MDVENITLTLGSEQIELAGEVDFNVVHKNGDSSFNTGLNIPENVQRDDYTPACQSGKVFVSTGDLGVPRINVAGKRIDVDVEDKQFLKRVIKLRNEFAPQNPPPQSEAKMKKKKSSSPLAMVGRSPTLARN